MAAAQRACRALPRSRGSAVDEVGRGPANDASKPAPAARRIEGEAEAMMLGLLAVLAAQATAPPARVWPTREADVVLKDFRFEDGESMPQLRIHYTTLGQPHRN